MQPQRLHQHHGGELLHDERAARPRLAQLVAHLIEAPAQFRFVGFLADVDDRRQHAEQQAGVIAVEGEMAAGDHAIAAAVDEL